MEQKDVPFIVFEATMSRMERTIKRLWITIMLLICLLVGSNLAWLYYNEQFETVESTAITQEVEQEADNGTNNFIGGDYNGETDRWNNNC